MKEYDHLAIEKKWQQIWAKKKVYKTKKTGKKYYVLDMFPYPSGTGLHVGHPKGYIGSDILAREKRMQGFNVLHPMGYDAFGLPAEQYALEHHINPREAVKENVKTFEKQLSIIGLSYDWDRKVNTTDPDFYHWTQWIFLKIYNSWYNKDTDKAEPIETLIKRFEKSGNAAVNAVCDDNTTPQFSATDWKAKTEKEKQDTLMKYRLAYEGYSEVNWCEVLGTVLANDEVVDSPKGPVSERGGYPVVKREMRQWFLRITAYADRLLSGLEGLNWSEHIKEIERNWIGRSEGAEVDFGVPQGEKIRIFTTRPDTIFGVTFIAISPELAKKWMEIGWKPKPAISEYIEKELKNREVANATDKEKTGIAVGFDVVNPATKEKIPVWIANYVLGDVGTGAIMAVPAHDERDFEFAKKYNLPVKYVVMPDIIDELNPPVPGKKEVPRKGVLGVVYDPKKDRYLMLKWKKQPWTTFVTGGIEDGEDAVVAARREIEEEVGLKNLKLVRELGGPSETRFFAAHKDINRVSEAHYVLFEYNGEAMSAVSEEELAMHETIWVPAEKMKRPEISHAAGELAIILSRQKTGMDAFVGTGVLLNSGKFSGIKSEQAKSEIVKFVGGKIVSTYKMRDAVFARQRYWGEPIPLFTDKKGLLHEIPAKKLPLRLPDTKSYMPTGTGEGPLANVPAWKKKGLESNTMPGWAGSSWYFLRYMDPRNKKAFADKKAIQYWKNVDMYVGGAEHATGHLLYARFWHKFLKDYGLVVTEEPFQTLRNQGMILGSDNRKMSKRWGNVVNPNDVVRDYGADTLRVYEAFIGPFEASLPWSTDNIIGSRRFLEKVWRLVPRISRKVKSPQNLETLLHKTIKKVTQDIENFAFNTAVSAMMILTNEFEKQEKVSKKDFELFLKILSPFAPHMTEEIWRDFGHKTLLVTEKWPKPDHKKLREEEVSVAVQINNKVRAVCRLSIDSSEEEVLEAAKSHPDVDKWLLGKEIKKVIFVKDKLINIITN